MKDYSKERIKSIDSLKGLSCAVLAFIWHYLNMQPKYMGMPFESVFGVFYNYGQYLVELFFMISGFSMTYIYKDQICNGIGFSEYIIKRMGKIYPLFFITLMSSMVLHVIYLALFGTTYAGYKVSPWHLVLNLLCVQTGWLTVDSSFNGPAWCISVQLLLYILFYITTRLAGNENDKYYLLNCVIFVISTSLVYRGTCNYPFINMFSMRGVSCFFGGVVLYETICIIARAEQSRAEQSRAEQSRAEQNIDIYASYSNNI